MFKNTAKYGSELGVLNMYIESFMLKVNTLSSKKLNSKLISLNVFIHETSSGAPPIYFMLFSFTFPAKHKWTAPYWGLFFGLKSSINLCMLFFVGDIK